MHLRAAMRASVVDDLSPARFAATERVVHTHDADRFCRANGKILASANGHPKTAHESPARSAGTGAHQIEIGRLPRQIIGAILFDGWLICSCHAEPPGTGMHPDANRTVF